MNEGIAGLGGPAIIILCHLNRSLSWKHPSRPARGGWIEMIAASLSANSILSRPARGGWIEMKVVGTD